MIIVFYRITTSPPWIFLTLNRYYDFFFNPNPSPPLWEFSLISFCHLSASWCLINLSTIWVNFLNTHYSGWHCIMVSCVGLFESKLNHNVWIWLIVASTHSKSGNNDQFSVCPFPWIQILSLSRFEHLLQVLICLPPTELDESSSCPKNVLFTLQLYFMTESCKAVTELLESLIIGVVGNHC